MPDQTTQPVNNLELTDLQNLLMIIDVASQRGAFKGPELSQVGAVFDKVNQFLQNALPKSDQTESNQSATPTPAQSPLSTPVSSVATPPFALVGGNN
jgi:hypothetical protein